MWQDCGMKKKRLISNQLVGYNIISSYLPNAGEEPSPLVEHLVKSVGRGDWDIDPIS